MCNDSIYVEAGQYGTPYSIEGFLKNLSESLLMMH